MARPATLPALLEELRTYLDQKDAEWDQGGRVTPTLPATADGKVNVRSLMREFRDWATDRGGSVPSSAWQYVYANKEWAHEINAVAVAQGLKAVGSRTPDDGADDAVQSRMARLGRDVKVQSEGHAQAKARIAHLERELSAKEAENQRLRERFALMRRTGVVMRVEDTGE
ncbi:hypothetical protein WYO_5140 [Methylobacterium sp. GXF4]|uniref:hypothetical protein n=1 Tax=Methylobacterium sp. GXF4 TaxID=1096546 RepID=UPI0002699081|nr:hypothetical protein [Methylobacterium sp. GXF4]EIZ82209.1 hypothetical protein WYO_5140 [Methylobacterium sp. GXF4]